MTSVSGLAEVRCIFPALGVFISGVEITVSSNVKWKQVLWWLVPGLFPGVVLLKFPDLQLVREGVDNFFYRTSPEARGLPLLVGFVAPVTIISECSSVLLNQLASNESSSTILKCLFL